MPDLPVYVFEACPFIGIVLLHDVCEWSWMQAAFYIVLKQQ